MAARPKLPAVLEAEVLFRADHTCCICHTKGKDVQIHHIDANSRNNEIRNLAVVCLDCHSRVTGPRGLGKRYSPAEVRLYKRHWEFTLAAQRQVHRKQVGHSKELVTQIDLIVCEILASEKDQKRAGRLLRLLYEIHLWRGSAKIEGTIVDGLGHLAAMGGLSNPWLAARVAESAWHMCWHLVGPHDMPLRRDGVVAVQGSIRILETIAAFNAQFAKDTRVVRAWEASTIALLKVGVVYQRPPLIGRIVRMIAEVLRTARRERPVDQKTVVAVRNVLKSMTRILPPGQRWRAHRVAVLRLVGQGR